MSEDAQPIEQEAQAPAQVEETSLFVDSEAETWKLICADIFFPLQMFDIESVGDMRKERAILRDYNDVEIVETLIPNVYGRIHERILRMILTSFELLSYKIPVADYTVYIFGISKAMEQLLCALINAGQFPETDGTTLHMDQANFSKFFSWDNELCSVVVKEIYRGHTSEAFEGYLCEYYAYFKSYRHRYFHSNRHSYEDIATLDSIEDTESIIRYMSTFIDRISEYI